MSFVQLSARSHPYDGWDGGPETNDGWDGWLSQHSYFFDQGVKDLKGALSDALDNVGKDPSNATYLADYQEKLSQYNLYRMLQSNSVKSLKDTLSSNVRNVG
jgi:type III secretion protein F